MKIKYTINLSMKPMLKTKIISLSFSFFLVISTFLNAQTTENKKSFTLFDLTKEVNASLFKVEDAFATITNEGLHLIIEENKEGIITFNGQWDLSDWIYVTIALKNKGKQEVRFDPLISGEIPNKNSQNPLWSIGWVKPGETRVFNCLLIPDYSTRKSNYAEMDKDFPNMRGMPDGISFTRSFDLKLTKQIQIKFPAIQFERDLVLVSIVANKPSKSKLYLNNPSAFFPFIDKYGQYKYGEWDGKIANDNQLKIEIEKEKKDLATHTGSPEWDKFGGYKAGPKLKATGHFRTEKLNGKWWIVTPEGNLFWSSGVNTAAKLTVGTPYRKREHFFENLPLKTDPIYGQFYNKEEYNFGSANLYRKYTNTDEEAYAKLGLERMKSWGINTLGGWSYDKIQDFPQDKRIPYTLSVTTINKTLVDKFPDVFDLNWPIIVQNTIKRNAEKANKDPYFFGYFVDNEMHWYNPTKMASLVLKNASSSVGKKEYINLLIKNFDKIEDLNAKAGTQFESWEALLQNKKEIDMKNVEDINIIYYEKMCHLYFKTIREAIDKFSKGNLFLGCRWHVDGTHRNKYDVTIGAQYLDILSFNQYDNELTEFSYPGMKTFDKPYLISEFNFGALDSGKFYPGLNYASDQRNRGEKYKNFIESGLRDPSCVGAHWFMWGNSTTAGRSVVGENANCGLVSETDTPYYELINYIRKINYSLYQYRNSN
jgi:hypothetical protein